MHDESSFRAMNRHKSHIASIQAFTNLFNLFFRSLEKSQLDFIHRENFYSKLIVIINSDNGGELLKMYKSINAKSGETGQGIRLKVVT